jgi:hypothetical protein
LTQLALDVVFRSVQANMVDCTTTPALESSIQASEASEAHLTAAHAFLETVYSEFAGSSRAGSRAATPAIVRPPQPQNKHSLPIGHTLQGRWPHVPGAFPFSPRSSLRLANPRDELFPMTLPSTSRRERDGNVSLHTRATSAASKPKLALEAAPRSYLSPTAGSEIKNVAKHQSPLKGEYVPPTPRPRLQRPSAMPHSPDVSSVQASCDPSAEYAIVISMYEVYNDRIFDLLTPPHKSNVTKEYRRRPLLFKSTELSPDRKVVAGLRKVICGSFKESLMVLEAGLHERRVAGTGSNSVSSRSHGFFNVEVKKRRRGSRGAWGGSTLSIVDLAGSERAREAKTQGATLAEAGKINESLMYLGQCLQMQSDAGNTTKVSAVAGLGFLSPPPRPPPREVET